MAVSQILFLLMVLMVVKTNCQDYFETETELKLFNLDDALLRHSRFKCLQLFPEADTANFSDSSDTHCFLHCLIYKTGLMDLTTRSLNSDKFFDVWQIMDESFGGYNCLEKFDFTEPLNGSCNDSYSKLMEFRKRCLQLFEYTFADNSAQNLPNGKQIGQSASEYCDQVKRDGSLRSQYQKKLNCIFKNIHYLDAYGRVDEIEILLSFQEAQEGSVDAQSSVHTCAHRANSMYMTDYSENAVSELKKCLESLSPAFTKVFTQRDETSRYY